MTAYYNEVDPYAAQWLRNLIAAGQIAPGVVDERDIRDVKPSSLDGFTQCHFFAGIGIWSLALRSAGWGDDVPIWTGSCPCQPFSASGRKTGFDDERHLWPYWHWLIEQCRPETVFGEQVASNDGLAWADLVSSDLEATDYACGFVDTCAAGFGAFHIRQRLYFAAYNLRPAASWLGNSKCAGLERHPWNALGWKEPGRVVSIENGPVAEASISGWMADSDSPLIWGELGKGNGAQRTPESEAQEREWYRYNAQCGGAVGRLADSYGDRCQTGDQIRPDSQKHNAEHGRSFVRPRSPDNGWEDADWLLCRDGKWRPVKPGTFPLANECPSRVGRLRAYGNGLDAKQATAFVKAYMERDMVDLSAEPAGNLFEAARLRARSFPSMMQAAEQWAGRD